MQPITQTGAKICGISTPEAAFAALDAGADFLGFIHFRKSPRHLELDAMAGLTRTIRERQAKARLVSVVVDPDDALLEALQNRVKPDLIQLHGHEGQDRIADIASRFDVGLIKAISVSDAGDLATAVGFEPLVEHMMFDAKPPKDAAMPGGLGLSFDWRLMRGYAGTKPWFLAGGLTPDNVADAVRLSGAPMVDVSSGVESAPGVKSPEMISRFLKAVKAL